MYLYNVMMVLGSLLGSVGFEFVNGGFASLLALCALFVSLRKCAWP